jgi:hypothetical protein
MSCALRFSLSLLPPPPPFASSVLTSVPDCTNFQHFPQNLNTHTLSRARAGSLQLQSGVSASDITAEILLQCPRGIASGAPGKGDDKESLAQLIVRCTQLVPMYSMSLIYIQYPDLYSGSFVFSISISSSGSLYSIMPHYRGTEN